MTDHWRFNHEDYSVGDQIWVSSPSGWSGERANQFFVVKKSPKGQLTIKSGDYELRVMPRGTFLGQDASWQRKRVISADRAEEIAAENKAEAAWGALFPVINALEKAARDRSSEDLREQAALLAIAIKAATAGETEGLDPKDASAGPKDIAQSQDVTP